MQFLKVYILRCSSQHYFETLLQAPEPQRQFIRMWPFTSAAYSVCPWYHWPMEFGKEVVATLLTLNKGIEFSPILASWMFLLAAVNLCYPTFLPSFFRYSAKVVHEAFRLAIPWLALRYVWVPAKCMLCCFFVCMGLPHYLGTQWLSFLSPVLGVLFLISSLRYTGFTTTAHGKTIKRPSYTTGSSQLAKDVTTADNNNMRITRSGKVYPMGRTI